MANHDDTEQRAQRQEEIDRITAEYADAFRAGRAPKIEDFVQRYPEYAAELLAFAVDFRTIGFDLPDPDAVPDAQPSPAAQQVLARIRADIPVGPLSAIEALVKQGDTMGLSPLALAEAVGLSPDLLGKLEAHAIAAATIPRALVQRLAQTLLVAPETIAAFLGTMHPAQAGAFFYAEQAPAQQQESFLDAVRASALSAERQREWTEIVAAERGGTP